LPYAVPVLQSLGTWTLNLKLETWNLELGT
jgi:hypothetical protein